MQNPTYTQNNETTSAVGAEANTEQPTEREGGEEEEEEGGGGERDTD